MSNCHLNGDKIESLELFERELVKLLKQGCTCRDIALNTHGSTFKCWDIQPPMPLILKLSFFCLFALVALLSFIANSIVIWIILWHPVMRQRATNRHVLNLAFSDICLTLFNTIPIGIANVLEWWPFPAWSCSLQQMIGVVPFCVSVFTMVLISLDRYYAILYPLHRRPWGDPENSLITLMALAFIWLLALLFAMPQFFIIPSQKDVFIIGLDAEGNRRFQGLGDFCEPLFGEKRLKIYNLVMLFLQFLLPMLVLFYTYGKIAYELYWPRSTPENSAKNSILRAKRRTAKLFAMLVFSFLALWLPYELIFTVPKEPLLEIWPIGFKVIFNLAFLLAMSSTVVSPVIYFNMSERFRTGFCYALRWVPFWRGGAVTCAQYRDIFALNGNGCPRLSRVLYTPEDFTRNAGEETRCQRRETYEEKI